MYDADFIFHEGVRDEFNWVDLKQRHLMYR